MEEEKMTCEEIGDAIIGCLIDYINTNKLTLVETAKRLDVPIEIIKNMYYGKTITPKAWVVSRMADAMETSMDDICGRKPLKEHSARQIISMIHRYHMESEILNDLALWIRRR